MPRTYHNADYRGVQFSRLIVAKIGDAIVFSVAGGSSVTLNADQLADLGRRLIAISGKDYEIVMMEGEP